LRKRNGSKPEIPRIDLEKKNGSGKLPKIEIFRKENGSNGKINQTQTSQQSLTKLDEHSESEIKDESSSGEDDALTLSPRPSDADNGNSKGIGVRNSMFNILNPLSNRLSMMFVKKEDLTILKSIGPNRISDFQRTHGGTLSKPLDDGKREIYFLGIIDLLQKWNSKKQVESLFKGITNNRSQISAVEPKVYAKRFYDFVDKLLE